MNAGSNGLWEDEQPSVHKQTWSGVLGRFPQQSLDSPPIIRESINIILCCYCLWFCVSWAHLEQKALLAILCIPLFCNPVARPADLHKLLDIHTLNITHICQNLPNLILLGQLFHVLIRNSKVFGRLPLSMSAAFQFNVQDYLFLWRRLDRSIRSFLGRSPGQVALVLLALDN